MVLSELKFIPNRVKKKLKADDLPGINTAHQKQYIKHIRWSYAFDFRNLFKCHLNVLQAAHVL